MSFVSSMGMILMLKTRHVSTTRHWCIAAIWVWGWRRPASWGPKWAFFMMAAASAAACSSCSFSRHSLTFDKRIWAMMSTREYSSGYTTCTSNKEETYPTSQVSSTLRWRYEFKLSPDVSHFETKNNNSHLFSLMRHNFFHVDRKSFLCKMLQFLMFFVVILMHDMVVLPFKVHF